MSETIIAALIGAFTTILVALIQLNGKQPAAAPAEANVAQSTAAPIRSPRWIGVWTRAAAIGFAVFIAYVLLRPYLNFNSDLYDNFNHSIYDGYVDTNLWTPVVDLPNTVEQRDGVVVFNTEPNFGRIATLFSTKTLSAKQNNYAEAKLYLSSSSPQGEDVEAGVALVTTDQKTGRPYINLCVIAKLDGVQIWCEVYGRTDNGPEYSTHKLITKFDTWHTVRIEMTRGIVATYYIDGKKMGQYQPPDAKDFIGTEFILRLEVYSIDSTGNISQFDDVKIGQLK